MYFVNKWVTHLLGLRIIDGTNNGFSVYVLITHYFHIFQQKVKKVDKIFS